MNNKLMNPNAFREFKFREWKMARFSNTGTWEDLYHKMNWRQKLMFNLFGKMEENFRPQFKIWLDDEMEEKVKTGGF